jgi:hypothetical protein
MRAVDDDTKFDAWLKKYSNKNKSKAKKSGRSEVSKDEFFTRTSKAFPQPEVPLDTDNG